MTNKVHAINALKYTKRKMTIGSRDHFSDFFSGRWLQKYQCIEDVRDGAIRDIKSKKLQTHCHFFEKLAERAANAGCGNCAEQAAIAYFSMKRQNLHNIALIGYLDFPDDHAIAVVGIDYGSQVHNHPSKWGCDAWVCDPWSDLVFHAHCIPVILRPLRGPTLICSQ